MYYFLFQTIIHIYWGSSFDKFCVFLFLTLGHGTTNTEVALTASTTFSNIKADSAASEC